MTSGACVARSLENCRRRAQPGPASAAPSAPPSPGSGAHPPAVARWMVLSTKFLIAAASSGESWNFGWQITVGPGVQLAAVTDSLAIAFDGWRTPLPVVSPMAVIHFRMYGFVRIIESIFGVCVVP